MYTCECGFEAEEYNEMDTHLVDEHSDWCDDALQEYWSEAINDVFDARVTED